VSLLVCNLLIVITSLYRFLRTPPRIIEIGKPPVISSLNLPSQENDGLEPSGAPSNDDTSDPRERGRVTAESNVSMTSSGGGTGSSNTGSRLKTLPSTSTSGIELTELFESDFSMT
jgi:hypothetical protein